MQTQAEILELVQQYQLQFKEEADRIKPFISFVNTFESVELYSRKNFVGHLTASAFIINPAKDSLLLLKHKSLNKWLQPGGHIDAEDETIISAAQREVEEETGLTSNDVELIYDFVFDIDSHPIPENVKEMEPAHVHHDVRFLFQCKPNSLFKLNTEEATGLEWVKFSELYRYPEIASIVEKVTKLI